MLEFEAALATVEERLQVIPAGAAERIGAAVASLEPDWNRSRCRLDRRRAPGCRTCQAASRRGGPRSGPRPFGGLRPKTLSTRRWSCAWPWPLTALTLDSEGSSRCSRDLAKRYQKLRHGGPVRRTQHAVPISFGVKIAGWLVPLARHRKRLAELGPRALTVQFGGAAGTLSALGIRGVEVMRGLAAELGLGTPSAPWHSQRDGLAELAGWLSLVSGTLAKMGQDLALLAQTELGEASEGSGGRSSAMPH